MPKSRKQATNESAAESSATEKKQASAADIYGWEQVQAKAKPKRGRPRKVAAVEEQQAPAPTRQKKAESRANEKQPKAAAKPAAIDADEPADLVVFAFRLTQAEREEIHNAAGLNLKNHVDAVVERCTFYDCEIALRLRGPDEKNGGAAVTAADCTFDDIDVAIRTEDALKDAKITRPRFGPGVKQQHRNAGKAAVKFQITEEQTVEAVKKTPLP